jgi:hypothetical protein
VYAAVDVGAAIAQLTIEAVSRELVAHPMAGFIPDTARDAFAIPDGVRPVAVVAVGSLGDYTEARPRSSSATRSGASGCLSRRSRLRAAGASRFSRRAARPRSRRRSPHRNRLRRCRRPRRA